MNKRSKEYIASMGMTKFIITILEQELEGLKHDEHGIEAYDDNCEAGTINFIVGEDKQKWQLTIKKL